VVVDVGVVVLVVGHVALAVGFAVDVVRFARVGVVVFLVRAVRTVVVVGDEEG
jgi:hypothetical protein